MGSAINQLGLHGVPRAYCCPPVSLNNPPTNLSDRVGDHELLTEGFVLVWLILSRSKILYPKLEI